MEKMWLVLAEIVANSAEPNASEIGFMNITTWATSREVASAKIKQYLSSIGWYLVSVDRADLVGDEVSYGDAVTEMINRTRENQDAIILGTFHTYKTN
jgi:hypothetical protein